MATLNVIYRIGANIQSLEKGVDDAARRLKTLEKGAAALGSSLKTIGAGMTAAITVPLVAAGAAAIKFGMDAVESENLVATSFGNMLDSANKWSKALSASLGLNEFEMRKTAGTLFNMTTSMGLSREAAFEMSTGVAELAADMASFRNIGFDEALTKIRAGLVGEAEPLKAIGILVDENTTKQHAYAAGIAKTGAELNQQQKVLARWRAILAQTSNDQGDLARTIESPTNQLRLMRTQIEEAATKLGIALLPAVTSVIAAVKSLIPHLQRAVEWFTELPESVRTGALAFAALLAATGPVLAALGFMVTGIVSLLPVLAAFGVSVGIVAAGLGVVLVPAVLAASVALGRLLGELEAGELTLSEWVEVLWNWKLGTAGVSMENLKLAIRARHLGEEMERNIDVANSHADATASIKHETKLLTDAMAAEIAAQRDVAERTQALEAATKAAEKATEKFRKSAVATLTPLQGLEVAIPPVVSRMEEIREIASRLSSRDLIGLNAKVEMTTIKLQDVGQEALVSAEAFAKVRDETRSLTDSLRSLASGDFKTVFKDIKGFFSGGLGKIGTGFLEGIGSSLLGSVTSLISSGLSKLGSAVGGFLFGDKQHKQVNDMRDAFQATFGTLHDMNRAFQDVGMTLDSVLNAKKVKDFEKAVADFEKATKARLESVTNSIGTVVGGFNSMAQALAGDVQSLDLLASHGALAFQLLIAQGKSWFDALTAMQPGLSALRQGYADLGLSIEDSGLAALMLHSEILEKNPALLQAVSGLGAQFEALSDLGLLNVDTFETMQDAGQRMYTILQGKVAAVGGTTRDALLPMQDFLHKAEDAAAKLGIPLDENTQMLIDQSKELGIWKDVGKDATTLLTDSMQALVDKVGELIDRLNGIPREVGVSARVNWHVPDFPDIPDFPVHPMAHGGSGTVSRPTLFLAGEAGTEQFAFSGAGRTFSDSGGSGGGAAIPIVINLDGRVIAEVVAKHEMGNQRRERRLSVA